MQVDVIWTDDTSVNPPLPIYDDPDWAKGYDVVIHDECAAATTISASMKRILDAHQTVPAVHLHCAMHSFRNGTDQWFKHLGLAVKSGHGPQEPIDIDFVDKEHPITKTLEDWTTMKEELYNNVDVFDAHPLAIGHADRAEWQETVTARGRLRPTRSRERAASAPRSVTTPRPSRMTDTSIWLLAGYSGPATNSRGIPRSHSPVKTR